MSNPDTEIMSDEELEKLSKKHSSLRFLWLQKDRLINAIPKDFKSAITLAAVFNAVHLMLADPERGQKLGACTPDSLYNALLTGLRFGLDPATTLGFFYIVPYGSNATFQLGYRGMLELAYRTGQYETIDAQAICENDAIDEIDLVRNTVSHRLSRDVLKSGRGAVIGAWAVVKVRGMTQRLTVLTSKDLEKIRSRGGPAWRDYADEQSRKSVLKRALKTGPKGSTLASAMAAEFDVEDEDQSSSPPARPNVIDAEPTRKALPEHIPTQDVEEELAELKKRERAPARSQAQDDGPPFPGGEDMP